MSQNNLPRPDQKIYDELETIKNQLNNDYSEEANDRFLEIMNNYNWSPELFEENGKYGLKNWDGSLLLPAQFDDFRMMSSALHNAGDRILAIIDGKEGIALMNGTDWAWVIKPDFDFISYPNSIVAVKKEALWGIYDTSSGEYLVNPDLDDIFIHGGGFLFVNGIGILRKGDKFGVINDNGDISQLDFDEVSIDFDGLLRVRQGDKWGYVNEAGTFEEDEELAYWAWEG
jgi:hypothetical protein